MGNGSTRVGRYGRIRVDERYRCGAAASSEVWGRLCFAVKNKMREDAGRNCMHSFLFVVPRSASSFVRVFFALRCFANS